MSSYFLAPALLQLRDEVNTAFPHRDKSSCGWIGDTSHAARVSDHNPCWSCSGRLEGVVRALDTDIDDGDPGRDLRRQILNAAVGDRRVWYVISNGTIYSRTYGWAARRYTGSNGHFKHVHISLRHGVGEFDTSRWFPDMKRPGLAPSLAPAVDLSNVREQFLRALGVEAGEVTALPGVARVQRSLNQKYGMTLTVDGYVGEGTLHGYGVHEAARGIEGRPRVPDEKTLPPLIGPTYRMVA